MQKMLELNPDEQQPCCACCVFSAAHEGAEGLQCTKKRKEVAADFWCKRFQLDILAIPVPRKRRLLPTGQRLSID